MFFKLLKYEFKSVGKWYLGLFTLVAVFAIILGTWTGNLISSSPDAIDSSFKMGYQIGQNASQNSTSFLLFGLLSLAFIILLLSLCISTVVLIIRRFKSNIFGQQGYLTMTLPVSTHAILLSKLASAVIWLILALIACAVSFFLMGLTINLNRSLPVAQLFAALPEIVGSLFHIDVLVFVLQGLIGYASAILVIYLAIALAHLFENRRTLYGFLIYFGLSFVSSYLAAILRSSFNIPYQFNNGSSLLGFNDPFDTLYYLALGAASYCGVYYIVKNKLNI